jgi:putative heme-binding domain-containing protein
LGLLRVTQLALIRDTDRARRDAFAREAGAVLLARFPTSNASVNRELQILLAHLEQPGTIPALLAYLTSDKPQEEQIHTAYCLRTIQSGWNREARDRFIAWFDGARAMTGGASFEGFLDFIWQDTLALLPDDERQLAVARKARQIAERDAQTVALLAQLDNEKPKDDWGLTNTSEQEIREYLEYDPMAYPKNEKDWAWALDLGKKVFTKARCINCHVFGTIGKGGGPDLSTVTSRFRRGDLLEAIMHPSKVVSDQYIGLEVELSDFTSVTGMVVSEDERTLTLIDITGNRVDIPKRDIESRKPADRSVMPDGLINTMSMDELVALINFLEHGTDT